MGFVRKPVPNWHIGIFGKGFDNFLSETAVFDTVEHAGKDARRIRHGLFFADLRTAAQINGVSALVKSGTFKGTACSCGVFFKNERNFFALHIFLFRAGFVGFF